MATSCDKTLATTAAFTSIRVVCQNTLFFAFEDVSSNRRRHIKVAHNVCFKAEDVKEQLGLIDKAWPEFLQRVRKMADHRMSPVDAAAFLQKFFPQGKSKRLSDKAKREYETMIGLLRSAPGQEISTANGTLWGAVNAVSYYADHVRPGNAGERLNSAWFGAGSALKEKAWQEALSIIS